MVLTVTRASGLPICLEPEEEHALKTLEEQGRWIELEHFERDLRKSDVIKELKVECVQLEELILLLSSLNCPYPITIDFNKRTATILDNGGDHPS